MSFDFRPAASFTDRKGMFIAVTGSTCSGKTFSSLRLARGIAGSSRVAVLDTEGGRTLHLRDEFDFDANVMDPPFRPERFAEAAREAEKAGYGALVIDSFSAEWAGLGGVLDWQEQELTRMAGDDAKKRERVKMAAWIKPKMAHKQLVYSLLQRRMPVIFSVRGEESVKPGESGGQPVKIFKSICDQRFPFELTVAFRLAQDRKGYIDLSDPSSYKMEGVHRAIFQDGDQLSEEHGRKLAEWASGGLSAPTQRPPERLPAEAQQQPAPRRTLGQYLDECLAGCQTADDVERLEHEDPTVRNALAGPSADRVRAKLEGRYYALVSPPPEQPADELDAPMAAE